MSYKAINETEFDKIKQAQIEGVSVDGCRRKSGRSWDTVNRIFKSKSFAEYIASRVSATMPVQSPRESNTVRELRAKQRAINDHFEAVISTLKK